MVGSLQGIQMLIAAQKHGVSGLHWTTNLI